VDRKGASVELIHSPDGLSSYQHVVVEVGFSVAIDTVGEGGNISPLSGVFFVTAPAAVPYHEPTFFEIGNRVTHGALVRPNNRRSEVGIDGQHNGDRPRSRNDNVVPRRRTSGGTGEYPLHRNR
jgi:hypothetical protein